MEKSLDDHLYHKFLSAGNVTAPTTAMLKKEGISSIATFRTLQSTDFDQLSNRNKDIPFIEFVYLRNLLKEPADTRALYLSMYDIKQVQHKTEHRE